MLPDGWQEVRLGDIISIRKEKFNPSIHRENVTCIELEHIEKSTGRIIGKSFSCDKKSIKTIFYPGDVLYGKLRPNLKKYAFPKFSGVCTSEIWALKVDTDICVQKFVFYIVQTDDFTKVSCRTTGTKMPRSDWTSLKNYLVRVPSIQEQKSITVLLATWDTAIEKIDALIAAKERQFKWLLKTLISNQQNNPEWRRTKLGEILEYEQPTKYIVSSTNYTDKGHVPVLTANKSFVLGYTKEKGGIFNQHPVIIFDDFTTANRYVDFRFKVKSSAIKILKSINNIADLKFVYYAMKFIDFPLGGHQRYWISEYQHLEIKLPSLIQQKKIVAMLNTAHKNVDVLKLLVEQYRIQKHGLMRKLLTGEWKIENNQLSSAG